MAKYLVTADTYQFGYGCEFTLFGIFDTKKEAIGWIINNPVIVMEEPDPTVGYDGEKFHFFWNFEDGKGEYHLRRGGEKVYRFMTKEEYAERYVHEFDGKPMFIGGYQE